MFQEDSNALEHYLEQACSRMDNYSKVKGDLHFRCNICGDSAKSFKKKRAWVYKNKQNVWCFKCFNCGNAMYASNWLKKYAPNLYQDFTVDTLKGVKFEKKQEPIFKVEVPRFKDYPFEPIDTDGDFLHKAGVDFCLKRKIPNSVWSKFLICREGKYAGRIIIPFFNKNMEAIWFQARTLRNSEVKYLSMEGEKQIYNIDFVDVKKPIIMVEGPIDSMFVDNCIASCGSDLNSEREQLKSLEMFYLLDCDETGRKISKKLLNDGKKVFVWPKFLEANGLEKRDKWDINDVYLCMKRRGNFTFEELKPFFTNSVYDLNYF
jgi:5S rRNA maturation endonuclease (ribonuclease M5)